MQPPVDPLPRSIRQSKGYIHPDGPWCLHCRYSLRGLDTPRCPECGREFDPNDLDTICTTPFRPWIAPRQAVFAVFGLLLLIGVTLLILTSSLFDVFFWIPATASAFFGLLALVVQVTVAIWLYCRLRLPTAPWLAAYWIIAPIIGLIGAQLSSAVLDAWGERQTNWTAGQFVTLLMLWGRLLRSFSGSLVVIMITSEIVHLAQRAEPRLTGRLVRLALLPRQYATVCGVLLIVSAIAPLIILAVFSSLQ